MRSWTGLPKQLTSTAWIAMHNNWVLPLLKVINNGLQKFVTFQFKTTNMKKNVLLFFLFLFSANLLFAQKDYRVVFDLTSKDTLDHRSVLRWVGEISNLEKDAMIEVVMYG